MHLAFACGSGGAGGLGGGPEHAAEIGVAVSHCAAVGGGQRDDVDHARGRQEQAVGVAVAGALLYRQRPAQEATFHAPPARLVVALSVNPGVSMGEGSSAAQIALPENSLLDLTLKLPGQTSAVSLSVAISRIAPDGRLQRVWAAPGPVESKAAQGGRILAIRLDSNLFPRGDYAIHAGTPDEGVHETFVFRVIGAQ